MIGLGSDKKKAGRLKDTVQKNILSDEPPLTKVLDKWSWKRIRNRKHNVEIGKASKNVLNKGGGSKVLNFQSES